MGILLWRRKGLVREAQGPRRLERRTSEEDGADGQGGGEAGKGRLAARPYREEDGENEEAKDERQGQEKDGQDGERDGEPRHDRFLPSGPILGRLSFAVNKETKGPGPFF